MWNHCSIVTSCKQITSAARERSVSTTSFLRPDLHVLRRAEMRERRRAEKRGRRRVEKREGRGVEKIGREEGEEKKSLNKPISHAIAMRNTLLLVCTASMHC
jgi:hypothetical protein